MVYNDEMRGLDRALLESAEADDGDIGGDGLTIMEALVRDGFFESAKAAVE